MDIVPATQIVLLPRNSSCGLVSASAERKTGVDGASRHWPQAVSAVCPKTTPSLGSLVRW
jgi:hypothetical protein